MYTSITIIALLITGSEPLTADDCVKIALERSAQIQEAEAMVKEYEALLAEVESTFYPKLMGMAFIAPMFTTRGNHNSFRRAYSELRHWGPYTHLEATLAQPLYTFGRGAAGERAATERAAVERARVREAELAVALEVRKLYYLHLFALSMLPALNTGANAVKEAQEKGQELYDEGTGEITQADLMKLAYAKSEVKKFQLEARAGAALALEALKHTMGLPASEEVVLAEKRLPRLPDEEELSLPDLIAESATGRPEWAQIEHGKKAAGALEEAEMLAMAPVIFVAGQITFAWTPMRDDAENPYVYDPYNDLFGGLALGMMFDIDPALAFAKAEKAHALLEQVEALERFAATGIPLRVRKAHDDVVRTRQLTNLSKDGVKAAQKWMAFSAAAYLTGTGEAKDLLEGLVAFLSAKKGYYENLQGFYTARAELDFAVGR